MPGAAGLVYYNWALPERRFVRDNVTMDKLLAGACTMDLSLQNTYLSYRL